MGRIAKHKKAQLYLLRPIYVQMTRITYLFRLVLNFVLAMCDKNQFNILRKISKLCIRSAYNLPHLI